MTEYGKRPGVMIYFSDWKAVRRLNKEQRGELITAVVEFAETGVAQVSEDPIVAVLFDLLSDKVARDAEAYRETCINRAYSTYCRECKKRGEEPLERTKWYRMMFGDISSHQEASGFITRRETELELEAESEIESEPESEPELEWGRGMREGFGGTEGRGPILPSFDEITKRQRNLTFQIEEYRQRNGDFPEGF